MAIGSGYVAKLVTSLIEGGGLDNLLSKKLEALGEDFLRAQLGGSFGALGGQEQFDKLRSNWLNKAKGATPYKGFLDKLFGVLDSATQAKGGGRGGVGKNAKWSRSGWARSRSEWLDNHWKHDWRSQPRNPETGQWMAGRLDQIDSSLRYSGTKAGRKTKRRRKLRTQARARGRKAARKMLGLKRRRGKRAR